MRGINNGTFKGAKNVIRVITESINVRGFNNSNNDSCKETRKNIQTIGVRSRYG